MGRKEERSARFIGTEGENVRIAGRRKRAEVGGGASNASAETSGAAGEPERMGGPHPFRTYGGAGRERKRNR
ncbi:hypothetical protein MUK42_16320 [Musa troglodytarum]|uniref:Uncharacterized protein n=1 Tax=Musa troglodytarum TaxID=320322 RepID=A0A9E7HP28_9LILI|nr:hypothetical protein MUK42_16320 [Musa troglodytarum]